MLALHDRKFNTDYDYVQKLWTHELSFCEFKSVILDGNQNAS